MFFTCEHYLIQSLGFIYSYTFSSSEPGSGCQLYFQVAIGGIDDSIDSVRPPL